MPSLNLLYIRLKSPESSQTFCQIDLKMVDVLGCYNLPVCMHTWAGVKCVARRTNGIKSVPVISQIT